MANWVKSVEYIEITLTGTAKVTANLTKGQIFGNCYPVFGINIASGAQDIINRRYVEVTFETGPKVAARRDGTTAGSDVVVGIFVVEVDVTGDVSIEQGAWSMASGTSTDTPTISTVMDTDKAFSVISYRNNSTADDWNDAQTKVVFNSVTQLGFSRRGTSGVVTGSYYVIHTTGSDFSVQHVTIAMGSTDETATATITAVTLASSFQINTYDVAEVSDDHKDGGIVVDISTTTAVRARRAFDDFGDATADAAANDAATVEVQVISAGGTDFTVQRGECDWGVSTTKAVVITSVDRTKAVAVAGGYQGVMSCSTSSSNDVDANYATMPLTTDTELTGTRGDQRTPDGTTMFEVVEFGIDDPPATPVVESTTTSLEGSNTSSHTVDLPSGIVSGDLLIVVFGCDGGVSVSWPGGWTEILDKSHESNVTLAIAYRQADGGEGASITVTTSADQGSSACTYRISGHIDPSTQAPEASAGVIGQDANPNPDSLTPTGGAKNYLWIAAHAHDASGDTTAYPANYTNGFEINGTGGGQGSTGVAQRALNASSEDPGTFTQATTEQWVAAVIAVHPGGGATTTDQAIDATAIGVASLSDSTITAIVLAVVMTAAVVCNKMTTHLRALTSTGVAPATLGRALDLKRTLSATAVGTATLSAAQLVLITLVATAVGAVILTTTICRAATLAATAVGAATLTRLNTFKVSLNVIMEAGLAFFANDLDATITKGRAGWSQLFTNKRGAEGGIFRFRR